MATRRSLRSVLVVFALLAVAFALSFRDTYLLNMATIVCIYGILALGLGLLAGLTGQMAMGHGALFGIGAYVTAYLVAKSGMPFWIALGCAVVATTLAGILMGVVSLRFEGIYFAIVTFASSAVVLSALQNWRSVTGGANGLSANFDPPPIVIGGYTLPFDTPLGIFVLVAIALLISVAVVARAENSAFGRACVGIREDEILARCLSINAFGNKLMAFALSSALAGFAGGWYATYLKYITPELFSVSISIEMLMVLIIGGMLSPIAGPLIGSAVFVVLPELLRFTEVFRAMLFGALAVVIVLVLPEGIAGGAKLVARRIGRSSMISSRWAERKSAHQPSELD